MSQKSINKAILSMIAEARSIIKEEGGDLLHVLEQRFNIWTSYMTNPNHGGKITCHKCVGFFVEGEEVKTLRLTPGVFFHEKCFNPYEHYYGLDKPID